MSQSTFYVVRGGALGICQGKATHFAVLWCCMWREGSEREQCCLLGSRPAFSHIPHNPRVSCNLLVLIPGGWICIHSRTHGSLQQTLLWDWELLPSPKPPPDFTARGFEAFFPHAWTLGGAVCLTLQLFLPVYLHTNVEPPSPPASAPPHWSCSHPLPRILFALGAHLLPSYQSRWMFLL